MIKESYYVSLWTMEQSIEISNMDSLFILLLHLGKVK